MPLFFIIFLILAVRVAFLPGSVEGYKFMFTPRWEALKDPMIWIWAMGQAFFSLSVTGSGMIVYGAYLSKDEDVVGVCQHTALFDTIAAVVAALVIIPACFSYGLDVGAGPGLLFVTLPTILQDIPLGQLLRHHPLCGDDLRGRQLLAEHVSRPWRSRCCISSRSSAARLSLAIICGALASVRDRDGDDRQMGAVDGSCVDLYHPHRRDAGRGVVVLRHEEGRAAGCGEHREAAKRRRTLV